MIFFHSKEKFAISTKFFLVFFNCFLSYSCSKNIGNNKMIEEEIEEEKDEEPLPKSCCHKINECMKVLMNRLNISAKYQPKGTKEVIIEDLKNFLENVTEFKKKEKYAVMENFLDKREKLRKAKNYLLNKLKEKEEENIKAMTYSFKTLINFLKEKEMNVAVFMDHLISSLINILSTKSFKEDLNTLQITDRNGIVQESHRLPEEIIRISEKNIKTLINTILFIFKYLHDNHYEEFINYPYLKLLNYIEKLVLYINGDEGIDLEDITEKIWSKSNRKNKATYVDGDSRKKNIYMTDFEYVFLFIINNKLLNNKPNDKYSILYNGIPYRLERNKKTDWMIQNYIIKDNYELFSNSFRYDKEYFKEKNEYSKHNDESNDEKDPLIKKKDNCFIEEDAIYYRNESFVKKKKNQINNKNKHTNKKEERINKLEEYREEKKNQEEKKINKNEVSIDMTSLENVKRKASKNSLYPQETEEAISKMVKTFVSNYNKGKVTNAKISDSQGNIFDIEKLHHKSNYYAIKPKNNPYFEWYRRVYIEIIYGRAYIYFGHINTRGNIVNNNTTKPKKKSN